MPQLIMSAGNNALKSSSDTNINTASSGNQTINMKTSSGPSISDNQSGSLSKLADS